jgi:NADPH:quinone reductase-like Zn-dependent oxidoreductase
VRNWQLGDRVLIDPLLPCGTCPACRRGRPYLCPQLSVLGGPADGTLAEFVAVPAGNLHRVPEHLSLVQAAALPMALGTAWNCLFTAGRLQAGEQVLIHGIGGGVAQIAAQLAVAAGASVIATSSSEQKLARARELGVAHTVDYRTQDVLDAVRDLVGDEGVDLALDGVGGPALVASLHLAAPEGYGRVVRFGAAAHIRVDLPSSLYGRASVLIGRMADAGEMRAAVAFVDEHRITPALDDPLPLAGALAGLDRLRQGRQNGKVVIELPGRETRR